MPNQLQILQAIAEHLGISVEDIDRHTLLRDDLGLGPVELNELLNDLTEKFKVNFDPEDIEDLHTVDDLIVLVEDNLLE